MIKKLKFKDHDEWLNIRGKYIGGSDAGAVVGMNPYKSAYTLWAEKTGKLSSFTGNLTTEVGAYLEEFVAGQFMRETGKKVRKENSTWVNEKYPFACANMDRLLVGEKALLEIKTTNSLPNMKKIKNGSFPDTWYAQMTHYLAVSELKKAYLAVLVNCREFYIFELDRDEDEINALMGAEKSFWECVKNDTAPSLDGTQSTSDTLLVLYPESNGDDVGLMAYENDLRQYLELGEQIKSLKKLQDEAANRIKDFMGESEKGYANKYKVTWASSTRTSFDTKAFVLDHPELDLTNYYKSSNYRTFKVSEGK